MDDWHARDAKKSTVPGYYPQYDDTQINAKVPSQGLSDALVKDLKGKIKD